MIKKNIKSILISVLMLAVFTVSVFAAGGFTIHKVDDSDNPVEGAVFDVYGKPEVTWQDTTTTYSITYKLDGGNYNGDTSDVVEQHEQGTQITIKEAPVKEGYVFDYWQGSEYHPGDSYTVTEDHTFTAVWKKIITLNLELKYLNNFDPNSNLGWQDVVKNPQVVTISGNGMSEQTLSFTPTDKGPKEFKVPGPGTYTLSMAKIKDEDLQDETKLSTVSNDMPYLIDTVSTTINVSDDGSVTTSGNTYKTYVIDYNSNAGEFIYNNIDASKENWAGNTPLAALDTLNPHSTSAGASSTGQSITLNVVITQTWEPDNDTREQ